RRARGLRGPARAPMQLGQRVWRATPRALAELGLCRALERRPWRLEREACDALQARLALGADALLVALARWLAQTAPAPVAVGRASGSGCVYLGPALDLQALRLTPVQVLVANLFANGEPGLEALSAAQPPCVASAELLREVCTIEHARWLDPRPAAEATTLEEMMGNTVAVRPHRPRTRLNRRRGAGRGLPAARRLRPGGPW
ncbi:unnamed protein product, partial [Prorocentrum cordatum]